MNKFMIGDVVKIVSDFKVVGMCEYKDKVYYELAEISPHNVLSFDETEIPEAALAKTTFLGAS